MDDFLLYALLAGFAVALMAAPLGVFVVWRRMAYFGDTLAHSTLLGVALGVVIGGSNQLALVLVAILIAVLIHLLQQRRELSDDTLLGILAHSTLSVGLVIMALYESNRMDLQSYLLGDVLAVNQKELIWLGLGVLVIGLVLWRIWPKLLAITVHEELARVEGIAVDRIRLIFLLMIALLVALSMKVVGALLITSMLIIPAAAARTFSRTPEQMVLYAGLIGVLSVTLGLTASWHWDTPTAPSIVVAASLAFISGQLLPKLKN